MYYFSARVFLTTFCEFYFSRARWHQWRSVSTIEYNSAVPSRADSCHFVQYFKFLNMQFTLEYLGFLHITPGFSVFVAFFRILAAFFRDFSSIFPDFTYTNNVFSNFNRIFMAFFPDFSEHFPDVVTRNET
jgi:hypothetical protein